MEDNIIYEFTWQELSTMSPIERSVTVVGTEERYDQIAYLNEMQKNGSIQNVRQIYRGQDT